MDFGEIDGKTANGLVRHSQSYRIVAVIDSLHAGADAGEVAAPGPVREVSVRFTALRGPGVREAAQAGGEVQGFLDAAPVGRAPFTVMGDAACHFAIKRLRRGEVDDRQAGGEGTLFGQLALARAGAAEDQFFHGLHFR